jgi:hypothetical protein
MPAEAVLGVGGLDDDVWICLERILLDRWTHYEWRLRSCRVVTREEAREMFREAGKDMPPESEDRPETEGVESGREPLPGRLELILDVFKTHGSGPHRGKVIADLAQLEYNSDLRGDLAQLKRLGYLLNDGRGYERTGKPYP